VKVTRLLLCMKSLKWDDRDRLFLGLFEWADGEGWGYFLKK
jgi:hypothetical protein